MGKGRGTCSLQVVEMQKKMDSKHLYVVHRDYEKLRRERELELRLFPEEVIQSVIEYFEKNSEDLEKAARGWATAFNTWSDAMWFSFRCTKCGKEQRIALKQMNYVQKVSSSIYASLSAFGSRMR